MDFIGLLPISLKGYQFVRYIIDYFSRFWITLSTKTANAYDVIPALDRVFTLYTTLEGYHFNSQEAWEFFSKRGVALAFHSGASQSTPMIEIGNRLLEDVLQNAEGDWEQGLDRSTLFLIRGLLVTWYFRLLVFC